jgi:zinc transport system ATP-binding protein
MTDIIKIEQVTLNYGSVVVLENISLVIKQQGFLAVIGPNGGGKTTLLKLILGLLEPESGKVVYQGGVKSVADIGYVPEVSLTDREFPINVWDTVLLGLLGRRSLIAPFSTPEKDRALAALRKVDMLQFKHAQMGELSEGQRQRILIARALVSEPKVLLLDEPTASVDQNIQQNIYELLNKLKKNIAVVMVTHDIGTVSSYADEVACLNRKLHYHGGPHLGKEALEKTYCCDIDLIAHGHPHRVLGEH